MVEEIANIEYIVTETHKEALLLESNLIKKHQPKYNVLMKDDKSYLYIHITSECIPRVVLCRTKDTVIRNKKERYF